MNRRQLVKYIIAFPVLGSLLRSAAALAEWNVDAFAAQTEREAIDVFFPNREIIPSDAIKIGVHEVIENGAVVPIKIDADLPAVQSISIFVEHNPNPLIAHFDLSPECKGFIATRIKIGQPSDIIAIVQSEGKLYSKRKFVEVVEGGCG
ncbi:MAG: thiosulfate oxidation carrier protein SoxY [Gammaproteobacteria bacterium]|jgi:sulfur-oxidizing protein SoxY|nr:thiosulfate oxidation carrier protein SoxY [Gammaproteobacteria bacterium]